MDFFSRREDKLVRKDFLDICQCMRYEFCEAGNTVFKQGDEDTTNGEKDKFYVILKGEV